jgi:hypothetical protein
VERSLTDTLQDKFTLFSQEAQQAVIYLPETVKTLVQNLTHVDKDIAAALHLESADNQRLAFTAIEGRLEELVNELLWNHDPTIIQLKPLIMECREVLSLYKKQIAYTIELQQEINNPYITGIPLDETQETFVGRYEFSAKLEHLLVSPRCPPLLLYGQRRMGKTSLLYNLSRLLPNTIVPLFIDLQGPVGLANDHVSFLYNLSRAMCTSAKQRRDVLLPKLTREQLQVDPFASFDEWLNDIEQQLAQTVILLILDEFINLEQAFDSGRLNEQSILSLLRYQIQHRSRLKVLLAGSHTFEELQRWSNYLVNVHTLHISYLSDAETQQLVEHPTKDFSLRYTPQASQRVLQLTRGHPALVQLLCAEIVELKNRQVPAVRRLAQVEDVEAAVPVALKGVKFYFNDIVRNQIGEAARRLLRYLAGQGEYHVIKLAQWHHHAKSMGQSSTEFKRAVAQLLRRELIEHVDDGYRFQVELIRYWFVD